MVLRKLACIALDAQPRWMQERERKLAERLLRRPIDPWRPLAPGDIVVCGLMGTASGLGQGARQMLNIFQQISLPASAANASRLFALLDDFAAGPLWPPGAGADGVAIVHVNPQDFHLISAALRRQFSRRKIIAYWAWELETVPAQWARAAVQADEIWTPSRFVADAFRRALPDKPIHVAPHFIDVEATPTRPRNDPLPAFRGRAVVLFMYDVRSGHARKNPEAAIEAFRRAAGDDPTAVLVIKISNAHVWPESMARLRRALDQLANAHVINDLSSQDQLKDLVARADIVLSLHRSEGFGFLLAEAMAAAKPVIATGWSGNLDFMTPDSGILIDAALAPVVDPQHVYEGFGAVWAEPDINRAAHALRRLLNDPGERQRLGRAARAHALVHFSKERWLAQLPASFWSSVAREPPSQSNQTAPLWEEGQALARRN
ncbi:glycosyltransferase family 4 protein [Methylocapsa acidiphila]|uniref:glycosyltransferase family 4 protein n=1 Tax=Methylocapsa acidiphila TaxID=133552 RepID=UPI00040A92A0|nr:glycosyltransferase family 4 protein [Methylocapsa acidiphila]